MTIAPNFLPTITMDHRAEDSVRATIVVVNYNGGDDLVACLASLYADPYHTDYNIILVDNASTDDSARCAAKQFPDLTVLYSDENLGFGGANNLAAQHASGPYIAFLNPDTVVEPGWLKALVDALESNPLAGLATSRILLLDDPARINTAGNDVHFTGLTLCRGLNRPAVEYNHPSEVAAVSGAAFTIRRELFRQLGGFDHTYFMYFEDTDLSMRARLAGHRCLYVPQSVVYHDYRLRFGPHKTYYEERNRYLTLLKLYHPRTLLLLLPALLLAEIITWGFVLLRDRANWPNKMRAYRYLWRHRRALRHARRQVQTTRRSSDRALLQHTAHRLAFEQTGAGFVSRVAHLLFDPFFYVQRRALLLLLRGETT